MLAPAFRYGLTLAAACGVLGCDSFDFSRVVGPATSSSAQPGRPPSSASAAGAIPPPGGSAAAGAGQPRSATLVVVAGGDVELGGNVTAYIAADSKYDPLSGLRPVLEGTHLRLASLVTPITAKPGPRLRDVLPSAPRASAAALARAGLDVLDVSSERLWSYGKPTFLETLAQLKEAGVERAGASPEPALEIAPVEKVVSGWRVAVLAVSTWPEKAAAGASARAHLFPADPGKLAAAVREARATHDLVLVNAHGGPEYAEEPTAAQTALARAAVEAGADAVFMQGARVPLGVTWLSERPVLYGLGNLLAEEEPKNPWTGRSFVAKLVFQQKEPPTVDACPYLIVDGEPKLFSGPSRPTQEGVFRRAIVRLSHGLGGVTTREPDTHSCLRLSPVAKAEDAKP